MNKYKIVDSLGETIGYVVAPKKSFAQAYAYERFPFDNPKVKLISS